MAGLILIHKDRPNEHLCLVGGNVGIGKTDYGFLLGGRKDFQKMVRLDWYKKSAEEKNEDFIFIEKT